MSIISSFIIIAVSVYIMRKCSSSFDVASSFLTRNLGEGIKGPTINAIASSLPELLISSTFLFYFKDVQGFAAGFATIIGSSAFNIAVIPVFSFLYVYSYNRNKVFEINRSIIKQDVVFLLISIIILLLGLVIGINLYFAGEATQAKCQILSAFISILFVISCSKKVKFEFADH